MSERGLFAVGLFVLILVAGFGCRDMGEELFSEVAPNNSPSVAAIPGQDAVEELPFSVNLAGYVSDDNDAVGDLIFAVTSGGGSFTGALYTNTFTAVGSTTVAFIVVDTEGLSTAGTFDVTVAPKAGVPNNPPVIDAISDQTATANYTFILDVSGYVSDDYDADGELTYTVTSGTGSFIGTVYTNTFNTTGLHAVQFSATDTGGLSSNGSFNVDVQEPVPTNFAPTINTIPAQDATELSAFGVDLAGYVSDDHDAVADLTFAVTSGPGSFAGALYSNTFTTTGNHTIEFWVMDTEGLSATGSFDVAVAEMPNDPPAIEPISDQAATVGYVFVLDLASYVSDDHDADSDLAYAVTSGGGSFIGTVYTGTFDTTGLSVIQFSVTDTRGLFSNGSFNVDVQEPVPTNFAPTINTIPAQDATELLPFSLNLAGYVSDDHDLVGDLAFAVTSGGGSFSGALYSNTFTTTGNLSVDFVVMDTEGLSATGTFDVTVAGMPNDPPAISPIGDQTATVDYMFILGLAGYVSDDHDPDSELMFAVTSGGGSFTGTVYTNTFDTTGLHAVQFSVTDTRGQASSGSFNVDVQEPVPTNYPPTVDAVPAQDATELSPFSVDLTGYVSDDQDDVGDLTFAVTSGGGSFAGPLYSNTFTTTGSHTIEFWVTDTGGLTAVGSFDVTVAEMPNNPPVIYAVPGQTATVNYTYILDLAAYVTDDHDAVTDLTYAVTSGGGSFIGTVYTNIFVTTGLRAISISVTDTRGKSKGGLFNVTVQEPIPTNFAPTINPIGTQAATELSAFSLDLTSYVSDDHDAVGDLTFAVASGGGSFAGALYSNTFTTTGTITVEFWVMDTEGLSTMGSFDVTVAEMPNDPPTIAPDPVGTWMAALNTEFALDLSTYVSDDHDALGELTFTVTSGDGSFSGAVYLHTFSSEGTHRIDFRVQDTRGLFSDSYFDVDVYASPVAEFSADQQTGTAPHTVQFTDESTGTVTSWDWDFGDGGTSSLQDPSYMYSNPGIYVVTLTVTGPGGTDTETKADYITVNPTPPVADFTADQTQGTSPLAVTFSDLSTGDIDTWEWDFDNDGSPDSSLQNPSQTFEAGWHTISLTVTGPGGSDTLTMPAYIQVIDATSTWCVDGSVTYTTGDGTSWTSAFQTIQSGIDEATAAGGYQLVLVADGTYSGAGNVNLDFGGADIYLRAEDLYGTGTWAIDCQVSGCGFLFDDGESSDAVVDGFTITNGSALLGGGIYCELGSSPTIKNCTISNCNAAEGGGIYCESGCNPVIVNCTITGNLAGGASDGGGIYLYDNCSATITNCTITNNTADGNGGGIYVSDNSILTLAKSTVAGNYAEFDGGGIYFDSFSTVVITDSDISDNEANDGDGGGIYGNNAPTSLDMTGCTVLRNRACYDGGGICTYYVNATLTNCLVCNNTLEYDTDLYGGGIFFLDGDLLLTGCTISNNRCISYIPAGYGGGIYVESDSAPTTLVATNCTISGNTVQGYWETAGGGVCAFDASVELTTCTISDNRAEAFFFEDSSDEFWCYGGGIHVSGDLALTGCVVTGNEVYAFDPFEDDAYAYGGGVSTGYFYGPPADSILIEGCTVTGNDVRATSWGGSVAAGGGMGLYGNQVVVQDCTVADNSVESFEEAFGGGMGIMGDGLGMVTITDCTVTGNMARTIFVDAYGAGIFMVDLDSVTMTSCTINGNECIAPEMVPSAHGGGLFAANVGGEGELLAENCLFAENTASHYGGGMCLIDTSATIALCTIVDNSAGEWGGGIYCDNVGGSMSNSILWGNSVSTDGCQLYNNTGTPIDLDHCCYSDDAGDIFGSINPISEINDNPLFVDAGNGDYHLRFSPTPSPCIDVGNNGLIPGGITTDLDGDPRIVNSTVDIGAYEKQ